MRRTWSCESFIGVGFGTVKDRDNWREKQNQRLGNVISVNSSFQETLEILSQNCTVT
jgi:hypothetical protein